MRIFRTTQEASVLELPEMRAHSKMSLKRRHEIEIIPISSIAFSLSWGENCPQKKRFRNAENNEKTWRSSWTLYFWRLCRSALKCFWSFKTHMQVGEITLNRNTIYMSLYFFPQQSGNFICQTTFFKTTFWNKTPYSPMCYLTRNYTALNEYIR
jgi:hypothetical protein